MDRDRQPENFESPDFNVQNWMNSFFATTIAESTKLPLGNFDLHDPAFDFSFPETILTVGISELGLCAQKTECALSECFQGVQNGLPDAQQELKSIQNGILTLHQNYIHHQSQASRGTCQMLARTNAVDEEKKKSFEKTMSALCNVRNALEQRFKLAKLAWDLKHRIEKVEPCLHELKQDIPHESIQNLLIDICSLQSDLEQLEQLNLKIIIHSNLSRKPCCLWINTLNRKIQHVAGVLYQICEERCLRAWTTGDVRANQQNIASIKELKRLESICVRYAKFSLSPLQLTWKTDSERNTAGVENIVRILSRNVHTTDIFIRNQVTQIQEMFSPSCCCEQVMNAVRIGIEHTVVDGLKGFISYTTKPISPVSIILIQKFCEVLSPLLSPPTSGGLTLNKACIVHDAFVSIWDQWYSKMESSWFEEKMSLFPWIKELRQNVTLGADRLEYILTVELPLSTQDLLQMIRDSLHRCVDISSGWLLPKWHSTVYAGMLKYFVTHCHDLREVILSAGQIAKKPNFQELLNKTSCHLVFCLLVSCEDLVDSVHTYFTETVLPTAISGLDRKDPFDITGSFPLFQCEGRTTQVQRIADSYRSALHEYIQMQIHRNESSNYVSLQGGDHPEASHLNPLKDLIKTLQCELVEMFCHAVFFSDGSHTASFDTEYHVCNERSMCTRVQSERNSNMPLGCSPPMSIASDVLLNVPRYIESLTGPANVSDARMHRIKRTLIHEILLDCIEWYLRWLRTFLASLECSWRNSKDIRIRAGTSSLLDLQLVLGQLAVDIDHFVHACSALSGNLPATVERLMRVQECLPNCSVFYSLDPRVGTSPSEKSDDPSDVHRAVEHLEQTVRWLSTPLRRD